MTPRDDAALRKHLIYYFFSGTASYSFIFVPIEVMDDRPIDFAAMVYYPFILFFGTGLSVFAAFPVVFACMLVKALGARG